LLFSFDFLPSALLSFFGCQFLSLCFRLLFFPSAFFIGQAGHRWRY
jgi:hypothetical protein